MCISRLSRATNVVVLNGLFHLIIQNGWISRAYIDAHTMGFEDLERTVAKWTPELVERTADVPQRKLRAAAEILGTAPTLVSAVLQGVYQSMQATAAACQVNNLHLIRGLIGRDGCGVYQMNGQPTAQNARECGADGDLPGFRNWSNPAHIEELARLWNVSSDIIPHWAPPTHAMQIFRYCEQGSIKMLWISATNPAVSLPNLPRIRRILDQEDLFLVVQDAFMTETAARADVVLPAAFRAKKRDASRTSIERSIFHTKRSSRQAKPDRTLIFFWTMLRRMDFRDKDGAPLIKWRTPEEAFEAWKACSKGRPCDYSGMTYAKLTGGSGIQWPCNERFPDGATHLYTDGVYNTDPHYCETYGHDLDTGAQVTPQQYRAHNPTGRAIIKAADYIPPFEEPDKVYPLWLTTGRVVYHFHTRTKTGRVPSIAKTKPPRHLSRSQRQTRWRIDIQNGDAIEAALPARLCRRAGEDHRYPPGAPVYSVPLRVLG